MGSLRKVSSLILKFLFEIILSPWGCFSLPCFAGVRGGKIRRKHFFSKFFASPFDPFSHNGDLLCCMRHVYLLQWKNFKMMLAVVSNTVSGCEVLLTCSAEIGRINSRASKNVQVAVESLDMAFLLSLCFPCFSPFLISLCSASNPLHPSELREGWCVFYFLPTLQNYSLNQ